jgi:hypothetical protein
MILLLRSYEVPKILRFFRWENGALPDCDATAFHHPAAMMLVEWKVMHLQRRVLITGGSDF